MLNFTPRLLDRIDDLTDFGHDSGFGIRANR